MATDSSVIEKINKKINNGEISQREAEEVNELAYEKYVLESEGIKRAGRSLVERSKYLANLISELKGELKSTSDSREKSKIAQKIDSANRELVGIYSSLGGKHYGKLSAKEKLNRNTSYKAYSRNYMDNYMNN